MRSGRSHWHGLYCFLDDGRVEIDTNFVERTLRRQRRRWSQLGDQWASMIETAKLNAVNPPA